MDEQLYEWMEPTIRAVQPFCDETIFAAATFQGAGGWGWGISNGLLFGGLFGRPSKDVRKRAGGLPDTVIIAVGQTKIYVFEYKVKRMNLDVEPPVRVWDRRDVVARSDPRMVASKLTIDVPATGDHHELESTSMTGRLGKITREMFRLLDDPSVGAPTVSGEAAPSAPPTSGRTRARAGELADEIEAELKRLRMWMPDPPAEEEVVAGGAFGMNAVPFVTWLQVVLTARLRAIAAGEMEVPASSSVGTMAAREFDGERQDMDALARLIYEVDDLANRE
ncbi:MAG TPA: YqcC family protein [Actinomycetota bacterium]|nr:YqcC family protein [Actinomycetota bacterium]